MCSDKQHIRFPMKKKEYTAVLTLEESGGYSVICPELGVASQGEDEKEALANIKEAIELFLEDEDVQKKLRDGTLIKSKVCSVTVTG